MNVPRVRMVEAAEGVLGIEWIDGRSVRKLLPGGAEDEDDEEDEPEIVDSLKEYGISVGTCHQHLVVPRLRSSETSSCSSSGRKLPNCILRM